MSKDYNGIIRYSDTQRVDKKKIQNSLDNTTNSTNKGKIIKGALIGAGICLVVAVAVVCAILFTRKSDPPIIPDTTISIMEPPCLEEESRKLGSEFDFNTKKGDLKRINVIQKSKEDRLRDGEKITTFLTRITNYDIYIIDEQYSDEENKYYYDKLYTCALSIQSECYSSTNEDCEPKQRVDLTNSIRRSLKEKRNLESTNNTDLKGKIIPICLFNLTNNDVITSISCPESLPETKRKSIVLDLYFFRPPGLKRLTKENVNSTITRKTVGDRIFIREINGGICNIENAQLSFCTTDMNTTTDLENNILTYDEEAIMNITLDADNSYLKTKITNLKDISNKVENFNPQVYEQKLNIIIQKLKPYLKYEELFSKDQFYEFYILSKNGSAALKKMQKRKLDNSNNKMIKKENNLVNLFSPDSGISVDITLYNNAGINTDFMEAKSKLYIESEKKEDISSSKESSRSFNQIIKELYILSKSGNHLATELYTKINTTLEDMTEKINKEISKLIELVKYYDLSEIFDSSLSLDEIKSFSYTMIQESTKLKQKLEQNLDDVASGGIKQNTKILNKNIYDYLDESHQIINKIFESLNELCLELSSPKSKLTEISTYYLNNTSTSYISIVEKVKTILENYYKDEYNLISQKVDIIINEFELKLTESISNEMKIINNLYEKIENKNYTIKEANEEDLKVILNNLYYTKNYLKEIKDKIIEKLKKEMDIKANGYFISDYDMNSNQESFSTILEKITKISEQLDKDEYIDTAFDEVMSNIIRNFTKIMKYMEQKKEELFPLKEDILKQSTFSLEFPDKMKDNITNTGVDISNKIERENKYYLEAKQRVIKEFLDKNKENLEKTVSELDTFFSVRRLENISKAYEKAFNSSLETTKNDINENSLLSDEYLSYVNDLYDKDKMIKLVNNYHVDEEHMPYCISRVPGHEVYLTKYVDKITSMSQTQGYLSKYNIFKDNVERSKLYVNEQLFHELLSEYQTSIQKIREILQVFKNNKMSDKYPDSNELSFIDNHIKIIDGFYKRLNTSISDEIFNNKYIDIMNDFKETQKKEINNIIDNIESKHNIISKNPITDDYNYDFCLAFEREKTYTCVNKAVSVKVESDYYCLPGDSVSNNYLNLSEHSIEKDLGVSYFRSEYKVFYDSLSEKIYYYTSKIDELKKSLKEIETETINKNYTLNYLTPIKNLVTSLLSNKFGDEIINSCYNYYQPNIKEIIEPLLNNISFQWNQYFQDLYTDIQNNFNNFKNSIFELSNMAGYYLAVLNNNITKNYFNSIQKHQKSEFNYTIAYYYNILLNQVKSTHQLVISKLPFNQIGFNNIINKRKNEIDDIFNELIKNIEDSQNEALNLDQQLYVLDVAETNFFDINDILSNNELNNENKLSSILNNIRKIRNNKANDEISLSSRFYLENSESGKQINELYEQINEKVFVYLNLEQFKKILDKNWIFDQDNFIKNLKNILYNSNLEVQKELKIEEEKHISTLEKEITKTYNKDEISIKINNNYKEGVKNLELSQIDDINNNINDILDKIKQELTKEAKLLKESSNSYNKNFTKIQERLSNYKEQIIEEVKTNLFSVINTFYQKMNNSIYTNYYAPNLDNYISQAKRITSGMTEIKLLNSSYNSGEIIDNIILDLTKNYKSFVLNEIESSYNETYSEIKKIIENQNWEKLIIEKIDESYDSILLPALKEIAKYDVGITGYDEYDLNDNIIKDINEVISTKIKNINNIINETKGNNFEIDLKKWKKMDFSMVYDTVKKICSSLNNFISSEGADEIEKVDNFIKDIMMSNFNDLLENIIPSFGNSFFERIINYNENFKISSLYNTLKYSLVPTVGYYNYLKISGTLKALTKDLKLKIYSLNDLDLTAQKKNKEVLDLLNQKVKEFIEDSQEFLVNKYKKFISNDVSIEQSFSERINEEIKKNLYDLEKSFNDKYTNLMSNYFKDKLISSYAKVMNEKTEEMVLSVAEKRALLKSKLDDLFSLDPDTVLNKINNKINNTLYLVDRFYSHFNTFQISGGLKDFLNNYGKMNVQPKFQDLIGIVNYEARDIIISKIDKNYLDYKNYYEEEKFIEKADLINEEIKMKYINNINEAIDNYGKEEYPNILEKEINRQSQIIKRRRNRLLTEKEIENDYKEKIADKALDDTLLKILVFANNSKKFIDNYENFNVLDKIINENINKLNIAYKKSLKLIKDNYYSEELNNKLYTKLMELKNYTFDYFSSINESFSDLKAYLKSSINDIYNNLNQCANLTYITFSEKYENISKTEEFNLETDINLGKITDSFIVDNQNKITIVNYTISEISKKANFAFKIDYEEEGEIKKPIVTATIINESRPKQIEFRFIQSQELAGDIIEKVNIEPNNANFTMSIYYTTKAKDLYVTTITDFESYSYSTELVKKLVNEKDDNLNLDGINLYSVYCEPNEDEIPISSPKNKNVPRKAYVEESIVHESNLFVEDE